MYRLGEKVSMHLFGKSHAPCVGCILEGIPAGLEATDEYMASEMSFRKPSDGIGTPRKEADKVVFESGMKDGRTDGGPILITIGNVNRDSSSYSSYDRTPRPGHADLPALMKFPGYDIRGGGQFSGRMTAPIVAAGAIAKLILSEKGIRTAAFARSIGGVSDGLDRDIDAAMSSRAFRTRACSGDLDRRMADEIMSVSSDGDSVGGTVECITDGLPIGFGGIWFEALDSEIARAVFSIPAVKGVEFGKGFELTSMRGTESNDPFTVKDGKIRTVTNNMGGILGGMSTGMPMVFRAAFKPTPSIASEQRTVDMEKMEDTTISVAGRHDPCIVPRAVAVVEAVTALVVADQMSR